MKILVTDGANKNSLAILRALGRKHRVDITSSLPRLATLGSYSRYCHKTWKLQSDPNDLEAYSEELLNIIDSAGYDLLLPVGLRSYLVASKYKKEIQELTQVVAADWDKMQIAYNREKAMDFAQKIGVPTPKTYTLDTKHGLNEIDTYPVVIKSTDDYGGSIKYCQDREELEKSFASLASKGRSGIIAQQYISGFGCGFYGIYDNGRLIAHFMHKRIKEFPITGGPSAVAESYSDEKLFNYGRKLCDALKWQGPIMAEFKYDRADNEYKLIEINPKLWGSLDLTIAAGVNVPEILVRLAHGEMVTDTGNYTHIRYRWVFPDEWKVLMSRFSLRNLTDFFRVSRRTKANLSLSDPLPTIFQIARGFLEGFFLILSRRKRFPHGRIKRPEAGTPVRRSTVIADFHLHSKYSPDSILEPRRIVKLCKQRGYTVISITDHNTIKGSLEAKKYEQEFGISVLIGEEVRTDVGDIIGINLKKEIRSRNYSEVLSEIRQQGGISILPHPYKEHRLPDDLLREVDLIEGFNSRLSEEPNMKAVKLARKWNKPIVVGSDAHFAAEIGAAKTIIKTSSNDNIKSSLLSGKISTFHQPSPGYWIMLSQLIKMIKTGQSLKIPLKLSSAIRKRGDKCTQL